MGTRSVVTLAYHKHILSHTIVVLEPVHHLQMELQHMPLIRIQMQQPYSILQQGQRTHAQKQDIILQIGLYLVQAILMH